MSILAEPEASQRVLDVVAAARRRLNRLEATAQLARSLGWALPAAAIAALAPLRWPGLTAGPLLALALLAGAVALAAARARQRRVGDAAAAKRLDDAMGFKDGVVSAYQFVRAGRVSGPYALVVGDADEKLAALHLPGVFRLPPGAGLGSARLWAMAGLGVFVGAGWVVAALHALRNGPELPRIETTWLAGAAAAGTESVARTRGGVDRETVEGGRRSWMAGGAATLGAAARRLERLRAEVLTASGPAADALELLAAIETSLDDAAGLRTGVLAPPARGGAPRDGLVPAPGSGATRGGEPRAPDEPRGPPREELAGAEDPPDSSAGAPAEDPADESAWSPRPEAPAVEPLAPAAAGDAALALEPVRRRLLGSGAGDAPEDPSETSPGSTPAWPRAAAALGWAPVALRGARAATLHEVHGVRPLDPRAAGYPRAYDDFRHVAEAALYDETIPVARRAYLRSYFEAIRPKE